MKPEGWKKIRKRVGELLREIGVLWLTFGFLDALIRERGHEVEWWWWWLVGLTGIILMTVGVSADFRDD